MTSLPSSEKCGRRTTSVLCGVTDGLQERLLGEMIEWPDTQGCIGVED